MCGIVGYLGKKEKTISVLITGLKALEYRGYDSAGIAYQKNNKIKVIKSVGRLEQLESKIKFEDTVLGIGHTRWATHGKACTNNSHPHQSGNITLVHNGIIENYIELKEMLEKKGYQFLTETDTEVAAAFIDDAFKKYKNMIKALKKAKEKLKGSYAFTIINNLEPDTLYAMKKESPLILGKKEDELFLASDPMAISSYATEICYLNEGSIVKLEKNKVTLIEEKETHPIWKTLNIENCNNDKNGYAHYMLKEIYEQPDVIYNIIAPFLEDPEVSFQKIPNLYKYQKIQVVACGSAYHTGLVGKWMIETYAGIPVEVEIASEYRYKKVFYDKKTLVIVVSQSGETADTLASLRKANNDHIDTLALVNVTTSTIAREAKHMIPLKAGSEIAVATTKAYLAQLAIFSIITLKLKLEQNSNMEEIISLLSSFQKLPFKIKKMLETLKVKNIASKIYKQNDIFFLGRGIDYAICMEASLKLKEISYIHSEAYAAGELKHGTISLIEEKTPVLSLVTDSSIQEKTISNIKEVKARGAYSIVITNKKMEKCDYCDDLIMVPTTEPLFQPILNIIPFQLLAYEIALLRGCDIDKPKNLAKSVTVE